MKIYFGVTVAGNRSTKDKLSFLLTGNSHPNCTVVSYSDPAEVEAFIRSRVGPAQPA